MLIFGLANEPKLPSLGIPVRRNGAHLLEPLDIEIDRLLAIKDCLDLGLIGNPLPDTWLTPCWANSAKLRLRVKLRLILTRLLTFRSCPRRFTGNH